MKFALKDINRLPIGIHCYDRGVYLRVTPRGMSWLLKYSINGRRRELGLGGTTQPITAVLAKANLAKAQVAQGIDPLEQKAEVRAEQKRAEKKKQMPTFGELAPEALEHVLAMRQFQGARTEQSWRRSFRELAERFGTQKIDGITRDDCAAVLREAWTTKPRIAKDWQSRMLAVFDYAILRGWIEKNPAVWKNNLDAVLPSQAVVLRGKPENHHSAVSSAELGRVVQQLWRGDTVSALCAVFGCLTVGRASEFRCAQWAEIDLDAATFTVPPSRRKDKKPYPFVVPLSRQARALLHRLDTSGEFLFSCRNGRPLTLATVLNTFKSVTDQPITTHGLRSTFADWCAKNEKNFLVSEKCLMHAVGNQVFRAYQRDDLLEQRRALLQEWADYLLPEVRRSDNPACKPFYRRW
ncbi:tyrosine-type recombinase/integrase [Alistipes finegoldii]|uniref:tyrosine-type recombinase/integrase n=1 Tax=Alistipes finegoldii TaxID=214856 RepID=UPI003AB68625